MRLDATRHSSCAYDADIRIRLRDDRIAERLREAAVVAVEEIGERRERVTAADRARISDGVVVDQKSTPARSACAPAWRDRVFTT